MEYHRSRVRNLVPSVPKKPILLTVGYGETFLLLLSLPKHSKNKKFLQRFERQFVKSSKQLKETGIFPYLRFQFECIVSF